MKWTEKCILDLAHHNLFEDDDHQRRFCDLLECYFGKPFFSKGLCKCMYLASWDTEHFIILLETLNCTLIEQDFSLRLLRDQGEILQAKAHNSDDIVQEEIWRLANSFMSQLPYHPADFASFEVTYPDAAYLIRKTILASDLIDQLPSL